MSHPLLDINNWQKLKIKSELQISYNNQAQYNGLKINVPKFYYFLKSKFGVPNADFNTVSHFFADRDAGFGKVWCYVFHVDSNFILISGDNLINITVLSLTEAPEEIDFEVFQTNLERFLEDESLESNRNNRFSVFVNYSFFLENLIEKFKNQTKVEMALKPPPEFFLDSDEVDSENNELNFEIYEYKRNYDIWLNSVLEKASITLQIQILLPIYFESLVDLAFRVKLKESLFNYDQIYFRGKQKKDVFNYFEGLPLHIKLNEIKEKCFQVNKEKADQLKSDFHDFKTNKKRNKLLHGNSLFFKNSKLSYYLDDEYLIGFPVRHNAVRMIPESIQSSVLNEDLNLEIEKYRKLCDGLINVFDDNDHFRKLVDGIAFGLNTNTGGSIAIGINSFDDLFIQKD